MPATAASPAGEAKAIPLGLRAIRPAGGTNDSLWTIDGDAISMENMKPKYQLEVGRRYRLKFRKAGDDIHPGPGNWSL
jgi:hypothetical protein